jgi:hypothetical protein
MAAAVAAQVLALCNYFINTLPIPMPATDALIDEDGPTSFMDCIIEDTMAEEIIKHSRKMYRHPVDAQPVQQVM